jgi:hypothetical protein
MLESYVESRGLDFLWIVPSIFWQFYLSAYSVSLLSHPVSKVGSNSMTLLFLGVLCGSLFVFYGFTV